MAEKKNYLPLIFNNALQRFEDPVGLARPLLRDYSRYQQYVNADVAIAHGVLGMAHRATISYGYQDPFFNANYKSFGRDETYRTSYHVEYPSQPALKQVDNWYSMHPALDASKPFARVLDLELHTNQPASKIADVTWEICEIVKSRDGFYPIIYSRKNLIDAWLASWTDEMLNAIYWWLAQYLLAGYLEHPGPPSLPNRIRRERILMHQTSDHKLAPPGEVASKAVDWNRWELGNEQQMHALIKQLWGGGVVVPEPEPEPPIGQPIEQRIITASALNLRALPDAVGADLGTLKKDSDVTIFEKDGDWGRIEGWLHLDYTKLK